MSIVRTVHNKDNPYAMINKKALWDSRLSLEAVGLWSRLLSRPDDWRVSVCELVKSCGCSKDRIYRILNELIDNGYAYRHQMKSNSGKFDPIEFFVFEISKSAEEIKEMFPQQDFPDTVNPDTEKPVTGNTDITNTDLLNTERKDKEKLSCAPPPPVAVLEPWEKIEKIDFEGKKISVCRYDLVTQATVSKKDWSLEEIEDIWKIFVAYKGPIRNWFSFCEGCIKYVRRDRNTKIMDEQCKKKTKEEQKSLKKNDLNQKSENIKEPSSEKSTWVQAFPNFSFQNFTFSPQYKR